MKTMKLYLLLIRTSIRSSMQYKFNFLFSSFVSAIISLSEFMMVALVLLKFGDVKGWSLYEVGYLYGVIMFSKAIYRTFASDVHHLENYLVTGNLDSMLIRPLPVLTALMTQNVKILVGEFVQSGTVLVICLGALIRSGQITWTAVPLTVVVIGSGAVFLFSIGLATATVGFWTTRVEELHNLTEDAARTAAQYPLILYPKWLLGLLITILPVGLVNYIPALYILRHEYGIWLIGCVVLFSIIVFCLALKWWRFGLSRYQSTGT